MRKQARARRHEQEAAYTVAGECERLFCAPLRRAFLGEKNAAESEALAPGVPTMHDVRDVHPQLREERIQVPGNEERIRKQLERLKLGLLSPDYEDEGIASGPNVNNWVEVWDYAGGARFRAAVCTEAKGQKALFVFFEQDMIGKELKHGLMALLELAEYNFDCSNLVACVDRTFDEPDFKKLIRDLGWVGFELTTLEPWTDVKDETSDRWLFLNMDI